MELEPLIGFFVNTIVLRTKVNSQLSFSEYLQQVRQTNLEAQNHQAVPFELLVDELNPERSNSHNPLFQIMLMMGGNKMPPLHIPGLTIEQRLNNKLPAKFELTLNATELEDGLELKFEYNTDLFTEKRIRKVCTSLTRTLAAIVANPKLKLSQLQFIDAK